VLDRPHRWPLYPPLPLLSSNPLRRLHTVPMAHLPRPPRPTSSPHLYPSRMAHPLRHRRVATAPRNRRQVPTAGPRRTTALWCAMTTLVVPSCPSTPSTHTPAGKNSLSVNCRMFPVVIRHWSLSGGRLRRVSPPSPTSAAGRMPRARALCSASTCWTATAARSARRSSRRRATSGFPCWRRAR
jgi:hypothetical protein